jgi:2-polyprenyl-3-methyl-5-hydroxy-6-metoxy-1,4-benzoquinol methylase
MSPPAPRAPWNHNIHYHGVILNAVGDRASTLDVGCGDGLLARELAGNGRRVQAIDVDVDSIKRARLHDSGVRVRYLHGDFLKSAITPESLDAVVSVAALHHMDEAAALRRMRDLVRPGGTVAVVGLARGSTPADLLLAVAASIATRALRLRRGWSEVMAPTCWPPPSSYRQIRRLARRELPGVRYRRHLLWRYSLVWIKPEGKPECRW